MVEPSAKIDKQYKTVVIADAEGLVHTGIVIKRDDQVVQLLANPLDEKEPETIRVEDIEEEFESKISMMPMGLLNTLTKEEILDLLAFIESAGDPNHPAFKK